MKRQRVTTAKELLRRKKTLSAACLIGEGGVVTGGCFDLSSGQLTIGRNNGADITLPDPSASRFHARIELRGNRFVITDDSSQNGVYINSVKVKEQELSHGDVIWVGTAVFRVNLGGTTPQRKQNRPDKPAAPVPQAMLDESTEPLDWTHTPSSGGKTPKPNRRRFSAVATGSAIGLAAWVLAICLMWKSGDTASARGHLPQPATTSLVAESTGHIEIKDDAVPQPQSERPAEIQLVRSRIGGHVGKFEIAVGSRVARGQLLARLSNPTLSRKFETLRLSVDTLHAVARQTGDKGAMAALRTERRRLAATQKAIASLRIASPADGTVIELRRSTGTSVRRGDVVARVLAQ